MKTAESCMFLLSVEFPFMKSLCRSGAAIQHLTIVEIKLHYKSQQ